MKEDLLWILKKVKLTKIYRQHLQVKAKRAISILIMLVRLEKMVMNKLLQFLKRLQIMKKNMLSCGLKNYMMGIFHLQKIIY